MALKQRRLEEMRQITKPIQAKSEFKQVWCLIDEGTGQTIGIYSSEDLAWTMSEELWSLYRIEADVECVELDQKV